MNAKRPDDFVVEVVSAKRLEEPKVEVVQLTETKSYIIPEGYKTPVKELESKLLKTKDHSWSVSISLCEISATDESLESSNFSTTSRLRTTVSLQTSGSRAVLLSKEFGCSNTGINTLKTDSVSKDH